MKIFLVYEGDYEDARVVATYTTQELADEHVAIVGEFEGSNWQVEEQELCSALPIEVSGTEQQDERSRKHAERIAEEEKRKAAWAAQRAQWVADGTLDQHVFSTMTMKTLPVIGQ